MKGKWGKFYSINCRQKIVITNAIFKFTYTNVHSFFIIPFSWKRTTIWCGSCLSEGIGRNWICVDWTNAATEYTTFRLDVSNLFVRTMYERAHINYIFMRRLAFLPGFSQSKAKPSIYFYKGFCLHKPVLFRIIQILWNPFFIKICTNHSELFPVKFYVLYTKNEISLTNGFQDNWKASFGLKNQTFSIILHKII